MIFYSISTIQFLNRAPNEENFDFYLSFFLILLHLSLLDTPDNEEKKTNLQSEKPYYLCYDQKEGT